MQRKLYHGMLTVKTFNKYIPYQVCALLPRFIRSSHHTLGP